MLTKVAAALIAVTMFSAPVLAQSAAPVSNVPAQQIKAKPTVKHVKIKKHTVNMHRGPASHAHQARAAFCEVFARRSGFGQVGAPRVSPQLK